MGTFEASNGARFSEKENGTLVFSGGILDYPFELSPGVVYGLREFFQHERDEELGRWRWPDNPEYVVYAGHRPILVLNELTGDTLRAHREDGFSDSGHGTIYNAAGAYFEAHPERKPWHDAKTGEAWLIDVPAGPVVAVRRLDGRFYDYEGNLLAMQRISGARRMYPEAGER